MATENIIMACVAAGLSRQDAHEEIRVLSHEASAVVKQEGKQNDLIERVKKTKFFEPIIGKLETLLDSSTFVGRSPEQVDAFLSKEVWPKIEKYSVSEGVAELKV